jgi:hypothetical protein
MAQLRKQYPDAAENEEAAYRLGAYYFDRRELDKASECFSRLKRTSTSGTYQRMCDEYLRRIEHLAHIQEEQSGGD